MSFDTGGVLGPESVYDFHLHRKVQTINIVN